MFKRTFCIFLYCLTGQAYFAQTDSLLSLSFDFNEQQLKEVNNKVVIKSVGVTLTQDRFGNRESAVYIHGHPTSYINLGTSNLLKPKKGTISLWVNLQTDVLSGKGYPGNPFLIIKNGQGEDFIMGYCLAYNYISRRLGAQASKDSLKSVSISSKDTVSFNTWYHMVITSDNDFFSFYLNGRLEGKLLKGFESKFFEGDSVILGRSTGPKNERYAHAIFDDLRFYHRVLSENEIQALYHEPNPNRITNILFAAFKYIIVIIILVAIIILLLVRNKTSLKKQKEFYELNNRVKELEIKVIKTQMNPHFISNCLAAIQNLIFTGQVDKAGEYLAKFSLFLRQVLDYSDKTYLTLKEELTIIKLNIELEQLRFKNEFEFKLEIDESIHLDEILLPSLITQPFIENAIWHGLLPLQHRSPRLEIKIYKHTNRIYIALEDNGVGRTEASAFPTKKSRGTKLAADKIDSINRLRNSSDYKLEIIDLYTETKESAGTLVIIQLSPFSLDE